MWSAVSFNYFYKEAQSKSRVDSFVPYQNNNQFNDFLFDLIVKVLVPISTADNVISQNKKAL